MKYIVKNIDDEIVNIRYYDEFIFNIIRNEINTNNYNIEFNKITNKEFHTITKYITNIGNDIIFDEIYSLLSSESTDIIYEYIHNHALENYLHSNFTYLL